MTKFLQYKGEDDWWEWPQNGRMTVYNMHGGHHDINENSEYFMEGTVIEAEDWPDLCRKTGYNPWKTEKSTQYMWIAPDGTMHKCDDWGAHEATAQDILENLLGEIVRFWDSGDRLIEMGWVKVSTNQIMMKHYCEAGLFASITPEQKTVLDDWAQKFNMFYW